MASINDIRTGDIVGLKCPVAGCYEVRVGDISDSASVAGRPAERIITAESWREGPGDDWKPFVGPVAKIPVNARQSITIRRLMGRAS